MSIKSELDALKNEDIYSLLLFALYKCRGTNEFSALSELAFILDENSLLSLCEYFGGLTITIPTIEELELMLSGLTMYKNVNVEGQSIDDYTNTLIGTDRRKDQIKLAYSKILDVMSNYSFGGSAANG
jgi:hypothetical protein